MALCADIGLPECLGSEMTLEKHMGFQDCSQRAFTAALHRTLPHTQAHAGWQHLGAGEAGLAHSGEDGSPRGHA